MYAPPARTPQPRHAIHLRAAWAERHAGHPRRVGHGASGNKHGQPGDGRPRLFRPKPQTYKAGLRYLLGSDSS